MDIKLVSKLMLDHFKKIKKYKKLNLIKKKGKVLDIGSNDASFLKNNGKNYDLWGIDPSAKKFKKKLQRYEVNFRIFSQKKIFLEIIKINKLSLTLFQVSQFFYDVDNPNEFCKDIEQLLTDDGVWICEFSYLPLMLKNLTFDQICHEHLTYYTFTVFEKILNKNGLKVIDFELNEINGGSIEVIITKKKKNVIGFLISNLSIN